MNYVDGFVLPVATKNLAKYKALAKKASKVWMEHGALAYHECVAEDVKATFCTPFPKMAKAKPGETVVFAWIVYKSKAHRDRVNMKVMKDPRLGECMDAKKMPFDLKRMACGGFKEMVKG